LCGCNTADDCRPVFLPELGSTKPQGGLTTHQRLRIWGALSQKRREPVITSSVVSDLAEWGSTVTPMMGKEPETHRARCR